MNPTDSRHLPSLALSSLVSLVLLASLIAPDAFAGCPGSFTTTASSKLGGTISPSGDVVVLCGGTLQFTITPDPCYSIAAVIVDGGSVGAVSTYDFAPITEDHTIHAEFVLKTFTIVASAGVGGSIFPPGASTVDCDAQRPYTVTPDPQHVIADVLVDGVSQGAVADYSFSLVDAAHTIRALFTPKLSIGDARVVEGNGGPATLSFRMVAPSTARLPITAHYQTSDGSATLADNDYAVASGDVTLQPLAPAFDLQWGTSGTTAGKFANPTGIAVDDDGNAYVADFGNNRIQKFDAVGGFLTQWGSLGSGDGRFNGPAGIAVDHAGNVYVTDSNNSRVQKFTNSGTHLLSWGFSGSVAGAFNQPSGIAVDLDGTVYVADQLNDRVQKFTADGVFLAQWGTFGFSPGQFDQVVGVAVDESGHVFVSDFGNRRVQRFDTFGNLQVAWTLPGIGRPERLAVDGAGTVLVADVALHQILAFDLGGVLIHSWGSSGTGDGQFQEPYGVAANHRAQVYVVQRTNPRVQRFTPRTATTAINVTVNGDTQPEPNETLTMTLTNPVNAVFRDDVAAGTIVNDDVGASIADATVAEGGSGTTPLSFSVELSAPIASAASVHYATQDGSATLANSDYAPASGDVAFAPAPPQYLLQWGSPGTSTSQFDLVLASLAGIALDAAGNVYVADDGNRRVQKFNASGAFLGEWGSPGSGPGEFASVEGVAVDPWGFVYVSDPGNLRIQKFESNGDYVASIGASGPGFVRPRGIAIDAEGFLYVVDAAPLILKFDPDGNFITSWGSPGGGAGQFLAPIGIAVDAQGNVYVGDRVRFDVQKFNSTTGAFIGAWGTFGTGPSQFQGPTGLATDGFGRVCVGDDSDRIQRFTATGGFIDSWGSTGNGNGQFQAPSGVAVDPAGSVFVVDRQLNRVQKFAPATPRGTFVVNVNGDATPEPHEYLSVVLTSPVNATLVRGRATGTILNDDAGLFATSPSQFEGQSGTSLLTFQLTALRPTCDSLTLHYETQDGSATIANNDYLTTSGDFSAGRGAPSFQSAWGSNGAGPGQFSVPFDVAVDDSGNVYVADRANYRVQKFSGSGAFVTQWGGLGNANGQFVDPFALAVDGLFVYVADSGNDRIQKFTTDGVFVTKFGTAGSGPGQFHVPHGVAIDRHGDVWVVDRSNDRVQKFGPGGAFLLAFGASGTAPGQLADPIGVAVDTTGDVFVVDYAAHRVTVFDASGAYERTLGTPGSGPGELFNPFGVAVGECGQIYVSDRGNNRIQEFEADGTFRATWGSFGSANDQFSNPAGIGIAVDGTVYVTDQINSRIQRFAPGIAGGPIAVTIQGDTVIEPDEAFTLKLTSASGPWIGTFSASGGIQNDDFAPTTQITSPNGGESWAVGSTQNITWSASDDGTVTSVDLAYSTNSGATFPNPIATGIANSGTFAWLVPNTPTTTARVRVTAHDDGGHTASDASDGNFSIAGSGPANLCGNPGFETNLNGWVKWESATLARVAGGRSGGFALQVKGGDSDDFGADDSPNWIPQVVAKDAVYRFSAWVRSDLAKGRARIKVTERLGSSEKGSGLSPEVTLGTGWQLLTVDYVVKNAGTTLSLRIFEDPKRSKEIFLIDDVSILLISAPADRAPVVSAPATATAPAGLTRTFTVTASDPDGQPITTFAASGLPVGATFSTNAAKTSGTFTWTPTGAQVSGTAYHVTFTATNALSGASSTDITVTAAPPNLIANGGFESGISGWGTYGSATLSPFTGGGHTGSKALQIATSSSSSFGCDDVPDAVGSTPGPGSVFSFSAWVRSVSHTGKVKIRVYEFIGSSQQGSTVYSPEISLTTSWQPLVATYTVQKSGSYLSMRITDASGNQTFLVDDVEVRQMGSPALLAGTSDAFATTEPGTIDRIGTADATGDGGGDEAAVPNAGDASSGVVRLLAARAEGSSLDPQSAPWVLRLEGLPQALEAEIPTVFLRHGGREVAAIATRTLLGEDADGNGIEELWASFEPGDVATLLADLPSGTGAVETTLEARSPGVRSAAAPLTLALPSAQLVFSAGVAPNPARLTGRLFFTTTRPGHARVQIYDAGGRRVRTLLDSAALPAGPHQLSLGGGVGRTLASGLYFYRVETGEGTLGGRFVLIQ